ncbi:hypothetical protein [Sinorhizobium meliloti]|uniref:hypothetical protein n=1 Tax=Rhizobium meliloti TaxID=382 RepID=UPI0003A53F68|nr:hypothetical protein [Sinorhizobium meliloti]
MTPVETSREEIEAVCLKALAVHGAAAENARAVASAIATAEADGNRVCGLYTCRSSAGTWRSERSLEKPFPK